MGPLRAAALALEFGFVVGSFIVAGLLLGRYLDGLWGTAPLMLMSGVLVGLGLSFYVMVLIFKWQREQLLPDFSIKAEAICHGCEWETPLGLLRLTNSMVIMFAVMAALILPGLLLRGKISPVPGGLQNFMEFLIESVEGMLGPGLGKYGRQLFPFVATFFIFILFANWFSLLPLVGTVGRIEVHEGESIVIPFLRPATADINMTLALAIGAFIIIHSTGIRSHGVVGHVKAVAQKSWLLFPIFLIIELFVIVSLSFRLFGNLFAGEVLLGLANWQGWIVGAVFYMLEVLFGLIQAIVFTMLTVSFTTVAVGVQENH